MAETKNEKRFYITIEIEGSLKDKAIKKATADERSMSSYIRALIRKDLGEIE